MKTIVPLLAATLLVSAGLADDGVTPVGIAAEASETIRERDVEGRVRVQREVRLNGQGDYVNHGVWRSWDAEGQLVGQGRYAWGKPTGIWTRWVTAEDAPQLAAAPFDQFTGPFLSQATYADGKLQDVWSVFDADGRLVSEISFQDGHRHGIALLRTASGEVFRRSRFEEGRQVGLLEELDADGVLATIAEFEAGRERTERLERYESGAMKIREGWLSAPHRLAEADDPWRLRLARYEAVGEAVRDGAREAWWPNGQPKLRADYRLGKAVGEANWWHENGQLALKGAYVDGLAAGDWSWWRENGVRAAACRYAEGKPASEWSLWSVDGRRNASDSAGRLARRPSFELIR